MNEELTYQGMVDKIQQYAMSYHSLIYAIALLDRHLTDPEFKECLSQQNFHLVENLDRPTEGLTVSSDLIIRNVESIADYEKIDFTSASKNIVVRNSHFVRARALNAIVEAIKHYFQGSRGLIAKLHTLEWFQVIYVLRNVASHFDLHNEQVEFPRMKWLLHPYPNTITSHGISISNGQYGHTVHYADKKLLELLFSVSIFFDQNENTYKYKA